MTAWPIADCDPVRLPRLPGHDDDLWSALIELSELCPGEWTLIGGQMVFLHAMEHGADPPRVSTDLDVFVNSLRRSSRRVSLSSVPLLTASPTATSGAA